MVCCRAERIVLTVQRIRPTPSYQPFKNVLPKQRGLVGVGQFLTQRIQDGIQTAERVPYLIAHDSGDRSNEFYQFLLNDRLGLVGHPRAFWIARRLRSWRFAEEQVQDMIRGRQR